MRSRLFITCGCNGSMSAAVHLCDVSLPRMAGSKLVRINQSLFYLSWLQDHRGDFELAAQQQQLGKMLGSI